MRGSQKWFIGVALLVGAACASSTNEGAAKDEDAAARSGAAAKQPIGLSSARLALERVYGVLDATRATGTELVVRSIGAKQDKGLVEVRLDLALPAESDAVASRHYGELRTALASESWCVELGRPNTFPIDDASGIVVKNFEIRVSAPIEGQRAVVGAPELDTSEGEMGALIRSIAAANQGELGRIAISKSEREPSRGVTDHQWKIEPAKQSGASLRTVIDFAASLEDVRPDAVVTGIELRPSKGAGPNAVEAWDYELSMTVRRTAS